jgi:hypothetical protein
MGVTFAPAFAQHVARYLADEAIRRSQVKGDIVVWIDNFILVSSDQHNLQILESAFLSLMKEVQLELKEESVYLQIFTALGITFDLQTGTATIPEDFKEGSITALETTKDALVVFGRFVWANYSVARQPMALYPKVLKGIREAAKMQLHERPRFDMATVAEMLSLEQNIRKAKFTRRERTAAPTRRIWTDASVSGMGVYDEASGVTVHIPISGVMSTDIAALEACALVVAAIIFRLPGNENFIWMTDNTVCYYTFLKGHGRNEAVNAALRFLHVLECAPRCVGWVSTDCQKADFLSRADAHHKGVKNECACEQHGFRARLFGQVPLDLVSPLPNEGDADDDCVVAQLVGDPFVSEMGT